MAAIVVMQPGAAPTWPRMVERVIGSVGGGLVAVVLGLLFPSPWECLVIIFPLAAATIALRFVNYTLFVLFLTPLFILVAELVAPTNGETIAFARGFNNVLGSVLGLLGCLFLWPDRAPLTFPERLAAAIEANLAYAALVLRQGTPVGIIEAARRQAGIASNDAEVTRHRMILEGRRRPAHLDKAEALLATLRRLAGASIAAWLNEETPRMDDVAARAAHYEALRSALGAWLRGQTAAAPLPTEIAPEDEIGRAVAAMSEKAQAYGRALQSSSSSG